MSPPRIETEVPYGGVVDAVAAAGFAEGVAAAAVVGVGAVAAMSSGHNSPFGTAGDRTEGLWD